MTCTSRTLGLWVRIQFETSKTSAILCVVMSCAGTDLTMGRSSVQEVLPKRQNVFIISEVNSQSKQTHGLKVFNV